MNSPQNWNSGYRESIWSDLDQKWDLIIIGGGITGAGIFREAVRAGLKTLLVEAQDFAFGTSSRSSKLVHGGLRYLRNAQFRTTLESVGEREQLLREGKGLISRLGFLHASIKGDSMPPWIFGLGLIAYDLMAKQWSHRAYDALDMQELCPILTTPNLRGGYRYFDAQTDDARLVLRIIREAVLAGGTALNYARVIQLLKDANGQVSGVVLEDQARTYADRNLEIEAKIVINATGAYADRFRLQVDAQPRLRPLRGSHIIFPGSRVPLTRAVSLLHPINHRPTFILPWEGVTLVGTTDVDHSDLDKEPGISNQEVEFLLQAAQQVFPELELCIDDIQGSFSGLRPVISTGKSDPSKESRDYAIWFENGLLTVTGGKLTTFRLMARDALKYLAIHFPNIQISTQNGTVLDSFPIDLESILIDKQLNPAVRLRLTGRYSSDALLLVQNALPSEMEPIASTNYLWAELRHAARSEAVVHLEDLMLRRIRLGLLLPKGGVDFLPRIRTVMQQELGWDDQKWDTEVQMYLETWQKCYNLPN